MYVSDNLCLIGPLSSFLSTALVSAFRTSTTTTNNQQQRSREKKKESFDSVLQLVRVQLIHFLQCYLCHHSEKEKKAFCLLFVVSPRLAPFISVNECSERPFIPESSRTKERFIHLRFIRKTSTNSIPRT